MIDSSLSTFVPSIYASKNLDTISAVKSYKVATTPQGDPVRWLSGTYGICTRCFWNWLLITRLFKPRSLLINANGLLDCIFHFGAKVFLLVESSVKGEGGRVRKWTLVYGFKKDSTQLISQSVLLWSAEVLMVAKALSRQPCMRLLCGRGRGSWWIALLLCSGWKPFAG